MIALSLTVMCSYLYAAAATNRVATHVSETILKNIMGGSRKGGSIEPFFYYEVREVRTFVVCHIHLEGLRRHHVSIDMSKHVL